MKRLFLAFFFLINFSIMNGQSGYWQYFVESKGSLNQLDNVNYLWLSTNAGLVKFDKFNFTYSIFDKINSALPSNFISGMATDRNGILWLAADNHSFVGATFPFDTLHSSLVKFNGSTPTEYNQNNSSIPNGKISQLLVDSLDNKWMIADYAIVKFDGTNWITYDTSNTPITSLYLNCLEVDIFNNIWVGTHNGLYKFDGSVWTSYDTVNSGLLSNYVFSLKSDSNGKLWIGTAPSNLSDGGLNSFDGITWNSYNMANSGLPDNWISHVALDENNNVWVSTEQSGLSKFDGTSWQTYTTFNSGLISNNISGITVDSSAVWIGSYNGLSRFDGIIWTTFNFNQTELPINRIWDIGIDQHDVKYFPTDLGKGLVKYDNSNWFIDTSFYGKLTSNVIAIDNNDEIWKGSFWDNELMNFDGLNWQSYNLFGASPSFTNLYSLYIDHLNNIWAGSGFKGLGKFNGVSWTVYDITNSGIGYNTVSSVDGDTFGNLWLGNVDYFAIGFEHPTCGLRKFDGINFTQFDTTNSGIISNEISVVKCDHQNNIWFSTPHGLSKFDGASFTNYSHLNSSLPNSVIRCINIDSNNVLWVGTDSGMVSFNGTTWTLYNQKNSDLPLDGVSSIKIDSYNNKWIAFGQQHPLGNFEGYGVTLFNENGIQGVIQGINDQLLNQEASVFPNPFTNFATLKLTNSPLCLKRLEIFNAAGIKLIEKDFMGNEINISGNELNSGMYFYRVANKNSTILTGKFIVED